MFGIFGKLLGPLFGIIDKAVVDKDLAKKIKGNLQQQLIAGEFDLQLKELDSAMRVITSEARSESWLTRTWRPITMLTFLIMTVAYWFGFAPEYIVNNPDVVKEAFGMIKIGLGGYVVGRSAEKTIPAILKVTRKG